MKEVKMIKFDPTNPVEPAMDIRTKTEALLYLKDSVIEVQRLSPNTSIEDATTIVKQNIGYFAAYYADEVGYRMERLFGAIHPVLGDMKTRKSMTTQQIFEIGKAMGEKIANG